MVRQRVGLFLPRCRPHTLHCRKRGVEQDGRGAPCGCPEDGETMNKKTVRDINVAGKRVLERVDFNVPLDAEQHITDDTRIRAALPTIQYLLEHGAAVILMSHLDRPDGKVVDKMSLKPVAYHLSKLLGKPVQMATDSIGPEVEAIASTLKPGQVLLLENLRFHKEEEKNNPDFARQLAS